MGVGSGWLKRFLSVSVKDDPDFTMLTWFPWCVKLSQAETSVPSEDISDCFRCKLPLDFLGKQRVRSNL